MNHRHRKVLHALFAHPVSGNISFRDVEMVLAELGATLSTKSGNRLGVELRGHSIALHRAGHSVSIDEIATIRKFLKEAGVSPDNYPV